MKIDSNTNGLSLADADGFGLSVSISNGMLAVGTNSGLENNGVIHTFNISSLSHP